jgi:hypothetical protein
MNRTEFLEFVSRNFYIGGEAMRLINNILVYAEQNVAPDDQQAFLNAMLVGTIGLTDEEIKQISLMLHPLQCSTALGEGL